MTSATSKNSKSPKAKPPLVLPAQPDFSLETTILDATKGPVAGVDEAGRGPLAGPVVAAAIILDPAAIPDGLNDSKKLSAGKRADLFDMICRSAHVGVATVSQHQIDRMNIRAATLYAMRQALLALAVAPNHVLVDGRDVPPELRCPADAIIKGDARSVSIAAASIIAKVTRDRMMHAASRFYPGYGFEKHMGYGTAAHLEALTRLGASRLHRASFAPVSKAIEASREPD